MSCIPLKTTHVNAEFKIWDLGILLGAAHLHLRIINTLVFILHDALQKKQEETSV